MINVKIYNTESFSCLGNYWVQMENGMDMTAFQTFDWYSRLNDQIKAGAIGKGEECIYAVAFKDGVPAMIAPLHIKKRGVSYKGFGIKKGIYVLGMWGFTDYLNFIYEEFCPQCFIKIAESVAEKYSLYSMRLYQLVKGSQLDCYLSKKHKEGLCNISVCVEISPGDDFNKYKKGLSKNFKQNIRTAKNRAAKEGQELTYELYKNLCADKAGELFTLYSKRSGTLNRINLSKGIKHTLINIYNNRYNYKLKKRLSLYNYIIEGMKNGNNNFILIVYAGNETAGFCYGLMQNENTVIIMIISFKEEFCRYSPGIFGIYSFLEDNDSKGKTVSVDLTRGTEKYKYDLGGTEHELHSYDINLKNF